jgi:hypothetical protein
LLLPKQVGSAREAALNSQLSPEDVASRVQGFDQTLIAGDYRHLGEWLTSDFVAINPLAQMMDRNEWLAWLATRVRYDRIERDRLRIRMLPAGAIVTATVRSTMSVVGLFDGVASLHCTVRSEVWTVEEGTLRLKHVHLTGVERD